MKASSWRRVINPRVHWVGALDWDRKFFDEIVNLPDGTSYNSFLVFGSDKTALIDTVEPSKAGEFLERLQGVDRIDFIVANHAEQDHSGLIPVILEKYPSAKVVCNELCRKILKDELEIPDSKFRTIKDKEELSLGDKTLQFIFTPWVHWPETMCTYLKEDGILFSGDFFGSHLATNEMFADQSIEGAALRYYAEIMMPYANMIAKNIQKIREVGPRMIASTHGPIYADPEFILRLYEKWVSPEVVPSVVIAYISMHGSTKKMVNYLAEALVKKGIHVHEHNLIDADIGKIAMDLTTASTFIVASPSFLSGLHPKVSSAVNFLNQLHPKTKFVGFMGSYGWSTNVKDAFNASISNFRAEHLAPFLIQGVPKDADFAALDKLAAEIYEKHIAAGLVSKDDSPAAKEQDDFSVVLCGEAGQGLQTTFHLLSETLRDNGYHIFSDKEYMSRIRGGSNSVSLRIGSKPMYGRVDRVDLFLPLDEDAYAHMEPRIKPDTLILGDKSLAESESHKHILQQMVEVPFTDIASKAGGKIFANTVAAGVVLGLFNASLESLNELLRNDFARKGADIVLKNLDAAKRGYEAGQALRENPKISKARLQLIDSIKKNDLVKEHIFLSGAEAIGLGAIAGGCNFISAYPMSPSTGVLAFLAQHRLRFNIIVEQAEDEIAGVNMAIGAWYAGGRAMANTSGGGFALMIEGVSLAGMLESPLVIHIAQRPGPATGLPTRTAQEDLNLALYSGHGEFPRAIFAPGTEMQGFFLTQRAFNLADKHQVPVFVLTDQYFMDSLQNISLADFDAGKFDVERYISPTVLGYKRFSLSANGVSPRGIPGGPGFVCVDSDEHEEDGRITESMSTRNKMVEKRLAKLRGLAADTIPPEEYNTSVYKYLIISWGSSYGSVKEAFNSLARKDVAFAHFSQVYPLHQKAASLIRKAQKVFVVEQNATGQFARLLERETGLKVDSILKYDGVGFSVEELVEAFNKRLK